MDYTGRLSMIIPLSLCFLSFIVCLFFGFLIYCGSSKRLEHKLFLSLCIINAWMSFGEFQFLQSVEPSFALFWGRAYIAPAVAVSVALHFVLVLTGNRFAKKKWFLGIIYIPNIIHYIFSVFTDATIKGFVAGRWGNALVYNQEFSLYTLGTAWITFLGLLACIVPLVYCFKATDKNKKKQYLYVSVGLFLPTVLGTLTYVIDPIINSGLPKLSSQFTMLQEILLGYAVWKFGLFDLNPATAAKNIVETMNDALIILDRDKTIVSFNSALLRLSQYREKDIRGKKITELFPGSVLQDLFDRMNSEGRHPHGFELSGEHSIRHAEDALTTQNKETLSVNISVSILHEKDGSKAGYVLVARDISMKKKAEAEKEKLIVELQEAIDNVKTLKGLIPICAKCKKIRDDKGYWNQIEMYISQHSEALFSHGLCPDCLAELYKEEGWDVK